MSETNLILGLIGMPPESARNCIQTLAPIPNGEFHKTINGDSVFFKSTSIKKYKSVITCKDINTPIIDKIWIGSQINVGCIQNLWQSIESGKNSVVLIRPPVKDSVNVIDESGNNIHFKLDDNEVTLLRSYSEKIFVCFRPWLTMQVTNFQLETNEWGLSGGWKLELEEV
ncbi:MAG: hypothetical protein IJ730_00700 [Alphaproteobacteria bacterium]|nr:hypothetical protein [Alphaproteobacteria bacterium]